MANGVYGNGQGDGINLNSCYNSSFVSNNMRFCIDGIDEVSQCDGNIYLANTCSSNSGDDYDINGIYCLPAAADRNNFNTGEFA